MTQQGLCAVCGRACLSDNPRMNCFCSQTPPPSKGRDGVTAYARSKICQAECDHLGHGACRECVEKHLKEAYEKGFLDCQAKAVEIVKDWPGPGGIVMCDDLDSQGVLLGHRQGFIKAIESLKGGAK